MEAAHKAALADGVAPPNPTVSNNPIIAQASSATFSNARSPSATLSSSSSNAATTTSDLVANAVAAAAASANMNRRQQQTNNNGLSLLANAPSTIAAPVNGVKASMRTGGTALESHMKLGKKSNVSAGASAAKFAPAVAQRRALNSMASSSSSASNSTSSSKKKGPSLRRGKWTAEEEAYANRLIKEFKAGLLPLTDGTTLRTFLSKLLNCDPMRISKKFVGSNCIGKQVFRRRTADINRLTQEQIQKSRNELSELERRFLERVAQTNRVKSSSNANSAAAAAQSSHIDHHTAMGHLASSDLHHGVAGNRMYNGGGMAPAINPWMRPPTHVSNRSAAAAGRALLGNSGVSSMANSNNTKDNNNLLAMAEMQRRLSRQNVYSQQQTALSNAALNQIARNASAARLAANVVGSSSNSNPNNVMAALQQRAASNNALSNIVDRQSSFDALMSLDIQSLQSIDNLANLLQNSSSHNELPKSGIKNWSAAMAPPATIPMSSNRSNEHMEQLLRQLNSNSNIGGGLNVGSNGFSGQDLSSMLGGGTGSATSLNLGSPYGSNASFNHANLLRNNHNSSGNGASSSNLLAAALNKTSSGNALNPSNAYAASQGSLNQGLTQLLARDESSTGLTALRMQDGLLNARNSSVEDFLSLVANGDIPHQDPHMLNVPLQTVLHATQQRQQQQQHHLYQNSVGADAASAKNAAHFLARQQLLAAASNNGTNGNTGAGSQANGRLGNLSYLNALSNAIGDGSSASNKRKFDGSTMLDDGGVNNSNSAGVSATIAAALSKQRKLA